MSFGVFGTRLRTNIVLTLSILGESHASELARLLDSSLSAVQNSLDTLEQAGIVAGVRIGRMRRVSLNPRFYAIAELQALAKKMAFYAPGLLPSLAVVRRRPRRAGKKI